MINEFLVVKIDDSLYALNIVDIQCVIEYTKTTRMVGFPEAIVGVVHHFDKIWNIIDLKKVYNTLEEPDVNEEDILNSELELETETEEELKRVKIILSMNQKNGLIVDEALTIEKVDESNIKKLNMNNKDYSIIDLNGEIATIITIEELLDKIFNKENIA